MGQNDKIQLFEDKRIRTAWDEEKEEWFFSIVDVIAVLTDSKDPAAYWRKLKQRMREEGSERGCKKTAPRQKRPLGKGWPLQIERKGRKKGAKEQAGGKTGRKRWGMMVS